MNSTKPAVRILALGLAVVATAALVVDAVVFATTGARTMITDDTAAPAPVTAALGLVLGLTFGAGALVVRAERARFEAGTAVLRLTRAPLQYGLTALAVGLGIVHPVELLIGLDPDSTWMSVSGVLAFAVLIITQLSATTAGLACLRRSPLGLGGRLLAMILPVVGLTVVLGLVIPGSADPAFVSAVTLLGVALIGVRAPRPSISESTVQHPRPRSVAR